MPGSRVSSWPARSSRSWARPRDSASAAAGFGPGMPLDLLPGCPGLAVAAAAAVGDDGFGGVSEAELIGVVCAWDRVEAHAAARKLAAIAELIRPDGTFTWTTPAGRTYTTEPTRYSI